MMVANLIHLFTVSGTTLGQGVLPLNATGIDANLSHALRSEAASSESTNYFLANLRIMVDPAAVAAPSPS
jgi:hypothetical protein